MSSNQRLIVIVGLVVVAAIGFVVLKGTDDSDRLPLATDTTATTTPAPAETTPADGGATETTPTRPRATAKPAGARIIVRGLEPVGGVKRLTFRKGDTIRFTVVSDQPEEIHFHGYDVAQDVSPGRPVRFSVPAEIEGIFEVELEHSGTQIASITVEP
ncbi:hypothetical protein Q5424_20580 [Conexibacter sp. JD483]|uniref:hypothetical protein n=1 Tax=unclassified Conexibacter TaxID=2627773 RepID=UPI00271D0481|nr:MULTISPECIES: hypothetical protein [unclassified Conexibacter]MDO8188984.1 hypothetical protein [Conexibacter sp. CPCC 205706]MDO8201804.1 hypothetical protein [Conexibacter sp. CPCC 205762]MDR9371507.1 hypothetical protein [Conexibacter sp. JD483]